MEFIAGIASVAWALTVIIGACVNLGSATANFVPTTGQMFGIYSAILILQGMLACFGTKLVARMQWFFIVVNIVLVVALIIALAVATPKEFRNNAKFAFTDFENFNGWPNGYGFILSFLSPMWTIAGFDAAVHISEEAVNANIAVPVAMILATSIAGVLGFFVNMALAFFMGPDITTILSDPLGQPMATILNNALGQKGTLTFFAWIAIVLFFTGANVIIVVSRQSFAFARDGALPFSSWIYCINGRTGTPVNAAWFCNGIAFLLGILAFAGPVAINSVFTLLVGSQNIAYCIPIASRFIFHNDFKPGPFTLGRFGLPVAVVAVAWMIFMTIVFLFPTTPQVTKATMNYTVVVLGGWLFIALVLYYFPVYGGVHRFKGPVRNIESKEGDESHPSTSLHSNDEKLPVDKEE